jgi:hypothetical protein
MSTGCHKRLCRSTVFFEDNKVRRHIEFASKAIETAAAGISFNHHNDTLL